MPLLIDVGDGTLIVPPPASPPPPVPPAPPPPAPEPLPPAAAPAAAPAAQPILQPGRTYVDLGDLLGPPVLIPAPQAVSPLGGPGGAGGPPGGPVEGTDDLAEIERLLAGYAPDLSDLPDLGLLDPFGLQEFALASPPLKGGGALTAIAQACADYGVDARAAIADAIHEGANGGMGDGGLAYGPFQDHLTQYRERPFYGRGAKNPAVNAWAWSENGIRYSVRQMATSKPSAKGLTGHAAVYAIVYGYERPADKAGAYKTRAAEYDKLVRLGSGWPAYAAPLFKGPQAGGAVDTTPIVPHGEEPYRPAGVVAMWRELVDVFKDDVPRQHTRVASLADSLMEVFR